MKDASLLYVHYNIFLIQELYELTRPKAPLDLKAHVVITGYGTARTTISFLRKFEWECLIVDEGQALKNDKSELFRELCSLHVHHRVILTGTPLQNNIRELFNIMQYLEYTDFFNVGSLIQNNSTQRN